MRFRNTAQVIYQAGMNISPVLKIANPSASKTAGQTTGLFRNGQIDTPQTPAILDGKARAARKKRRGKAERIEHDCVSKMEKETYCMGLATKDSTCNVM
jgi:hypothetical protein